MAYRPSDEKTPILFIKHIFGILRALPLIVIDSCSSSPAYILIHNNRTGIGVQIAF